jgi:hypothetical protein
MALIWVSVSMMVFIGLIGLALDTGYAVLVGGQLQHAADAAALAGAQVVYQDSGTVRNMAAAVGSSNVVANRPLAVDVGSDVTIGTFQTDDSTFAAGGRAPNAVRVVTKRTASSHGPIPLFFGGVFGVSNIDMTRTATAMVPDSSTPTVIVLDPSAPCALTVTGGTNLTVIGGPIQVNSTNSSAACIGGSSSDFADAIDCCGQARVNNNAIVDMLINNNMPAIPDPLAGLPDPPFPAGQPGVDVSPGTTQTLDPGYYTGGLSVRGTCNLNPGIYILGSPGLKVNSSAALSGDGVMIYIAGGSFDSSSTGASTHLSPPDPNRHNFVGADTYAGIVVFQARGNSTTSNVSLNGTLNIRGLMYFPSNEFDISSGGSEFGVRLIANQVKCSGQGGVRINSRANGVTDGKPFLVQ